MNPKWPQERIDRVRELAATGMHAGDIGKDIGRTQLSVIQYCARHRIDVVRYSPEQQEMYDRRKRDYEAKRNAKKVAANAKKKLEARLAAMARSGHSEVTVKAAAAQTSQGRRAHLPPAPNMTKSELRAMLTQAVRNTAEMQA